MYTHLIGIEIEVTKLLIDSYLQFFLHILDKVKELIAEIFWQINLGMMSASLVPDITGVEIMQQLEQFRSRTQMTSEELRRLEQDQESFALHYHECNKLNSTS